MEKLLLIWIADKGKEIKLKFCDIAQVIMLRNY